MRLQTAVSLLACLALASCAPEPSADEEAPLTSTSRFLRAERPLAGRYIVVLAAGPEERAAEAVPQVAAGLTARYGGRVTFTYSHALRGFAVEQMTEGQARALADNPAVAYVEEDGVASGGVTQSPATWGLDRIDQRDLPLSNSYTYTTTASDVHVYVLDSGIRATHTEFGGRATLDYTAISDGYGADDCHGHGTHVAGTVGGATYGVAKAVRLHSVRVLDCNNRGSWSGIIAGVDWVTANHVKPAVANMSLGGGANQATDDAVRRSITAGVTYVIAAMNENVDACNTSPARTPQALTVGATTTSDSRASYSNYGSCLDLFAPGSNITSASRLSNTGTEVMSGTSMATPHVAGVAALYLTLNPSATPTQVATALLDNTTPGKVLSAGAGSPNRLLYSGFIGTASSAIVVDNDNARNDTSRYYFQASTQWLASTSNPGYYGGNYHYATTQAVSDGATFYFYLDAPASRTIEAWWTTGSNRSTSAPYVMFDANGNNLGTVRVNQQLSGSQWNTLGTFNFSAGWNRVTLSRWTTTGFVVIADAVRVR
jgi:subtilisin family serine protease